MPDFYKDYDVALDVLIDRDLEGLLDYFQEHSGTDSILSDIGYCCVAVKDPRTVVIRVVAENFRL